MNRSEYNFPEKNVFKARRALDTNFDIAEAPELYVNLDELRILSEEADYKENLYFMLNINTTTRKLETLVDDFCKILLLGHRGCGKTLELRRMHAFLNDPDRYFSILIETEKELETSKMQAEDFFVIMVIKTIRELETAGLHQITDAFDDLLKEWLSDKEVQEEIVRRTELDAQIGVGVDTDGNFLMKALNIFKFKTEIKGTFASENKITTVVRSRIKKDLINFVVKFNQALAEVRDYCIENGHGRDLLFVIDGTEKTTLDFYKSLFQENGHILRSLNVNLITTIRLDAFYRLEDKPNLDLFETVFVPMVIINDDTRDKFTEIIKKRIDVDTFFDADALNYLVDKSGGSIRQLLRFAGQTLLHSRGKKVDLAQAKRTITKERDNLYHALSPEQKELLENRKWVDNWSHPEVSKMLFAMALLKYNGKAIVNPLLTPPFHQ